jgi:hypothetical protein
MSQFDISEFPDDPNYKGPRRFLDTDLLSASPAMLLRLNGRRAERGGIKEIVFVKNEEARLFYEYVFPLVKLLAQKRRLVFCELDSVVTLGSQDFPVILIDAEKITFEEFKKFMRLEVPRGICDYLENRDNPVFIYLRNIGSTKENLKPLMTCLLDGYFGSISRPELTHVLLTGVYGQPGINNCSHPGVMSRCGASGIDWTNLPD